ncbi:MAG TPA: hypothetical protein VEX41_08325 [Candidatus Eisenbacteria bacterium]|nr:hypothetical protein [Candidatus Eisenbacteria bacterium]
MANREIAGRSGSFHASLALLAAASIAMGLLAAACSALGGGPSGSQAATPPAGFPVGSWTTSISREDLSAGGLEGDLIDQNEGDFVLTFEADGTFQQVQTSTIGVTLREPIFRGHYTVTGDEVRLDPEFPVHYAQEGVYDVVRWQLDGDVLHLSLASHGDPIQVVVYGAHPWRRAAASGLVGTWQATVTREDLQRGGVADPGLLNENAGRFTRGFAAGGTWTMAQESLDGSPIRNPVFRGSYAVEGNEIAVHVDFPTEYQGDERYGWAVDGSELRLTLVEPADDVLNRLVTESHPWTRTSP